MVGPSEGLPDIAELADQLSDELDDTITARVSLVVEEQLIAVDGLNGHGDASQSHYQFSQRTDSQS